jgi:hypothetical protein
MGENDRLAQALEAVRAAHFDARGTACDYAALAGSDERGELASCLAALEGFDPNKLHIPAQTALWLNAYNACVLRDAAELGSESFFERERLRIAGCAWSLDDIEHGLLRGNVPKYGSFGAPMRKSDPRLGYAPLVFDERVHFAMYSGCRSSPPLRVLHGSRLDAELEAAARDYVRSTVRVKDEGARIKVPKLFHWYADDFGGEGGVLEFVVARLDEASVELVDRRQGSVRLKYHDFDWTLNQR